MSMAENPRPLGADPVLLADRFGLLAVVLIVAFSATVLVAIVPLQLLDLSWQYRFTGALIDNAPVALLGLALLHLAVYLDPYNPHLQNWRRRLGRLAMVAVVAFVLLIPLQGWVLWRGSSTSSQIQGQQLSMVNRELNDLLGKIERATSTTQLIESLPPAVVQTLGPEARRLTLPQLRRRLQADIAQAMDQLHQRIEAPTLSDAWTLWKRSLRVIVSSLAYAIAFLAFAVRRGSEFSLLQKWQLGWRPWNGVFPEPLPKDVRDSHDERWIP